MSDIEHKDEAKAEPKNEKLSYVPSSALSAAISGRGSQLSYSTTSGGTATPLAEVTKLNTVKISQGKVEATHYLSGGVEYKPNGWPEIGDYKVEANYTMAQNVTLYGLAQAGTTVYFTLTLPDGTTTGSKYLWAGFISEIGDQPLPNKDLIKNAFTITGTGALTVTAGT